MRLAAAFAAVAVVAAALVAAGSSRGAVAAGMPVFALCALLAFALQWLAFVPAWVARSERFYDLTGSASYLAVVALALCLGGGGAVRWLLAALVWLWALRLGTFLVRRVREDGGDGRFDRIKHDAPRFFLTWTLQGLWVVVTAGAALAALAGTGPAGVTPLTVIGSIVWLAGFLVESIADAQKRRFRRRCGRDAFIDRGLWRFSRHPNYAGEIVLWLGIALVAVPLLSGWQYATLVSPLFVYLLLTRVSGIPLLERRGETRWGGDPAYRRYLAETPVLFPGPPRQAR